jgi:flavorubredoxin
MSLVTASVGAHQHTNVDEIAPDTFRLSTFIPDVGPTGMTFNQFLIRAEQPLLFHTGHRQLFPLADAVNTIVPLEQLRWLPSGTWKPTSAAR